MMRYQDKVKYLSIALVVLLVAFGLGEFFAPERVSSRQEAFTALPSKSGEVAKVELLGPGAGASLTFTRGGGQWALEDASARLPVQSNRIEAMLTALSAAGKRRPVAGNKDSWKSLGLDDAQAKVLKLTDGTGKLLLELRVGSHGPSGSEVYARFGTAEASFMIDAAVASYLGTDRASWLDRRLFGNAPEAAAYQAFAVRADIILNPADKAAKPLNIAWRFERSGQLWKGGARELDAVTIESVLRAAGNLEATDLAAAAPAEAFAKVSATITLDLGSGKTRIIEIGAPAADGRFWARATEAGQPRPFGYQVSRYSLESILKSEESFAKK